MKLNVSCGHIHVHLLVGNSCFSKARNLEKQINLKLENIAIYMMSDIMAEAAELMRNKLEKIKTCHKNSSHPKLENTAGPLLGSSYSDNLNHNL